jgi:hypothetical protein
VAEVATVEANWWGIYLDSTAIDQEWSRDLLEAARPTLGFPLKYDSQFTYISCILDACVQNKSIAGAVLKKRGVPLRVPR